MIDERITVYWPSGETVTLFGRFTMHGPLGDEREAPYGVAIEALETEMISGQALSPGSVAMVDPRCLVVGEESGVIYSPRDNYKRFPREMREWMQKNKDWPSRLGY